MRLLFLALILGLVFGSGCKPTTVPVITPESPNLPLTSKLQVRIDPENAGQFILNPTPLGGSGYPMGMVVTIVVIPLEGWKLDRWAGPVFDKAGNTAKIRMTSGLSVVIKMKPPEKPEEPPTYTEVGRWSNSVGLVPKVCTLDLQHAYELKQGIPLQKGDRFEVTVVTTPHGRPVTVAVKFPHSSGRKTLGVADTIHYFGFEAIDDGTYLLVIAADWPRKVLPSESDGNACGRLKGLIQYDITVSRPNSK